MSFNTARPSESSSKNIKNNTPQAVPRTSEERVFGPEFFNSYPLGSVRRVKGLQISWQLLVSGVVLSATAFLVFLLGVNIVIQYRTMNPENQAGMFRKASFIVLDIAAIYGLIQGNVWLLTKLNVLSSTPRRDYRNYERLSSVEEEIELDTLK